MAVGSFTYKLFLFWYVVGLVLVGFDLLPSSMNWANTFFLALAGTMGAFYFVEKYGRRIGSFLTGWIFIISMCAEYAGAKHNFLFGSYDYTDQFVPLVWGVPLAIGFAWVFVIAGSHAIGNRVFPDAPWSAVGIAVGLPVALDLVLDPVSFVAKNYWIWDQGGLYYNIPFQNFFGWFVLSAFFMVVLPILPKRRKASNEWQQRMIVVYLLVLGMFTMLAFVNALWLAGLIGVMTIVLLTFFLYLRQEREKFDRSF
ncbi:MAG: carotenoid biosynthesis protein [Bacilli bacterium]